MTRTIFIAGALALAAMLPAQAAGVGRTFLSAAGSDSNNCANVLTPCRHLATAFAATAPDGEIYVLDPANYGSLTITHGVSIEGHGWASIAPVAGQAAITINANAGDKINIVGVALDGTAVTNTTGIFFNSGGNLTVRDSVIRNFSNSGIFFNPSTVSQLFVSNTLVSDNGADGIAIQPVFSGTAVGVLDHVQLIGNAVDGLILDSLGQPINVTIGDSVSANNENGLIAFSTASSGGTANLMVRNCTIANNTSDGLKGWNAGALIRVTRSTITGNGTGWEIVSPGIVTSYGDNNIDGNTSVNTEPPGPLTYK